MSAADIQVRLKVWKLQSSVLNGWMDVKELISAVGVFCVCLQAFPQIHSRATEIASWSSLISMTSPSW